MTRVGTGLDVHARAGGDRPLVLAGRTIPGAAGLAGHSDADVVAHAVADALLGAAGRGDLGSRFGTDDPALAGADSMELLAGIVEELAGDDLTVGNTDCTVVAEAPPLAQHRDAMVANLAGSLATEAVSVKITSTDGLGAIGRGEGIACWAVCLLEER